MDNRTEIKLRILLKRHYKDRVVDDALNIIRQSESELEMTKALKLLGITYWDIKNMVLSNLY